MASHKFVFCGTQFNYIVYLCVFCMSGGFTLVLVLS